MKPYVELETLISSWAINCEQLIVAEHPAEGKTKRIHCHVLLLGPYALKEQFDRVKRKLFPEDKHWSSFFDKTKEDKKLITLEEGLVYLLKGEVARLKYQKFKLPEQELQDSISKWVPQEVKKDATKEMTQKEKNKSHFDIIDQVKDDLRKINAYENKIGYQGAMGQVLKYGHQKDLQYFLCKRLKENHIKTSLHDLERWVVTILRDEPYYADRFFDNIFDKIFSKL